MTGPSPRLLVPAVFAGAIAISVAACGGGTAATWRFSPVAPATAPQAVLAVTGRAPPAAAAVPSPAAAVPAAFPAPARLTRLDLTIVTGDMIGKTEYPAYIPSDFTLPAYATVTVTVTNFEDATPLTGAATLYAKAAGLVGGTFAVTPIDAKDPNGASGRTVTRTSLDPATVSHTFTIPGLGVNVPIAPHARETFTFRTGAAGTFMWRCFDPCGTGPTGWGTAMAARRGYMEGTLTVAG